MAFKDEEKYKQYMRQYYLANKERIKQRNLLRKEEIAERKKRYSKTEKGHRDLKIKNWRAYGMKLREGEDWESIYYFVESCDKCEDCNNVFKSRRHRHLDHDHTTGYIRKVLCCSCNNKQKFKDNPELNVKIVLNFKK